MKREYSVRFSGWIRWLTAAFLASCLQIVVMAQKTGDSSRMKGIRVKDANLEIRRNSEISELISDRKGSAELRVNFPMKDDDKFKHQLEGPFNVGNPIHETLTVKTLVMEAGGDVKKTKYVADNDQAYWETVRGVIWNDDPDGLLFGGKFAHKMEDSSSYSTGIEWTRRFKSAEKRVRSGKPTPNTLTARSHFGDLQFLHGMASRNEEKARETREKILAWAEFTYSAAIGDIKDTDAISKAPTAAALLKLPGETTVAELFHVTGKERSALADYSSAKITADRALGSLLHVIQDSYSTPHVTRTPELNREGYPKIEQHLCYIDQDEARHGHEDEGPGPWEDYILKSGVAVVRLANQKVPWVNAKPTLESIFDTVNPDAKSGPGKFSK